MNLLHKTKDFLWRLGRLVKWFPVVWKDNDFDQSYLFDILKFKIDNMADFFGSDYAMSEDSNTIALQLKRLSELIVILRDEEYDKEAWNKEYYPKFSLPSLENINGRRKGESMAIHKTMKLSEKLHEKYWKEFVDIFSHYRAWWD